MENETEVETLPERPEVETLEPLALSDEPSTDKAFTTPSGTKFRARLLKIGQVESSAPARDGANIIPSSISLSLSLAMLDDDNNVATDASGNLIIMDKHEIVLSSEAMKIGLLDPAEAIDRVLRQEAYALEKWAGKQIEISDYLTTAWGGAELPKEPEPVAIDRLPVPVPPLDGEVGEAPTETVGDDPAT